MTTICSSCGNNLTETGERFITCNRCNRFTPAGSNSYNKKMKGGNNMTAKKVVKKTDTEEKKVDTKKDSAEALKKYFVSNNIEKVEARKIMSRVYTDYSNEINKNKKTQ